MDNFSHSLAGLVTAELVVALRARRGHTVAPLFPRVAWVTSVLANNLPDSDFLYTFLTGGVLGSLLHHRGHTHTLIGALLLTPLVLLVPWLWGRRRSVAWSRADWSAFAGLALLGGLLHIAFDGSNDYGVHPFWPLSNRWFYGDTIFIIEPWFWVTTVPLLAVTMVSRAARIVWRIPAVLILVVAVVVPFVPTSIAAVLSITFGGLTFAAPRLTRTARVLTTVGLCAFGLLSFTITGLLARSEVRASVRAQLPRGARMALTSIPLPSNPFCWTGLYTHVVDEEVITYRYQAAPLGAVWPVSACPSLSRGEERTAAWSTVDLPAGGSVKWVEQHATSLYTLLPLAMEDCTANALLRFVRVPFVNTERTPWVMGDLRYDREPGLGFTELSLGDGPCPSWIPPWAHPLSGRILELKEDVRPTTRWPPRR